MLLGLQSARDGYLNNPDLAMTAKSKTSGAVRGGYLSPPGDSR